MIEEKKFAPIQAYTLTFDELKAHAEKRETIVTQQGYLISSKDRRFEESKAKYLWEADVANAIHAGKIQVGSYKQTVNIRPPKEATLVDPRPLNKKGRPFSWSFSALSDFDGTFGCPLKYAHARYYCDSPFVSSEAMDWGNTVHKSGEIFVRDGVIDNQESFAHVEKYARLFRSLKEGGAEVIPELEIVLDHNMNPLTDKKAWFSKKAWFRVKIDVPIIQKTKASVFDYKTGAKPKEEHEQLHLCMAALGLVRPELEEFTGKLVWTKSQTVTTCPDLDRKGVAEVWENVLPRVKRMEDAWKSEVFQARQNGLCRRYCPVTICPHNGNH